MALSVQTTNTMSKHILGAAFSVGTSALSAVMIGSPIGPTGGAFLGGFGHVTGLLLFNPVMKKLNDLQMSTAVKLSALALAFFAGLAITLKALALAGFALTLKQLIVLNVTGIFVALGLGVFLQCSGVNIVSALVNRPQPQHT